MAPTNSVGAAHNVYFQGSHPMPDAGRDPSSWRRNLAVQRVSINGEQPTRVLLMFRAISSAVFPTFQTLYSQYARSEDSWISGASLLGY